MQINVKAVNKRHVCDPNPAKVEPGDIVVWKSPDPLVAFFPDDTPFGTHGPFEKDQSLTVRNDVPHNTTFRPLIALNGVFLPTDGDIRTD